MLVGLLLMVRVVVVWACQWIVRLESDQEKLMNLTALLKVLLMMIPLMNCATPFDIPFFLGGRPRTSLWSSWTRDGALSRDRSFISLYIQTPKSAPRQDIILIIIARTRLYKTNLMVIFVLDHPWHELLPSSLGSSLLHRAAKITMMTLLLLSLFSVLLHWLQYLSCLCSLREALRKRYFSGISPK